MSDDAEIVKAVAEGTMNGIMEPFKDLLSLLFKPVAGEIGEDLRDRYVTFRRTRTERLLTRTRQFIGERSVNPQPVPPKLLAAIIENGTLEEDDYLQDRWATLLAHSSEKSGTNRDLLPSAVEILKQINKWEVYATIKVAVNRLAGTDESLFGQWTTSPDVLRLGCNGVTPSLLRARGSAHLFIGADK